MSPISRHQNPWLAIGFDAWSLSMEATTVIGLRTLKIAAGGAAGEAESQLMVTEKIAAGLALQSMAISGGRGFTPHGAASKTLTHYRRKVRANRRRLLKS